MIESINTGLLLGVDRLEDLDRLRDNVVVAALR